EEDVPVVGNRPKVNVSYIAIGDLNFWKRRVPDALGGNAGRFCFDFANEVLALTSTDTFRKSIDASLSNGARLNEVTFSLDDARPLIKGGSRDFVISPPFCQGFKRG